MGIESQDLSPRPPESTAAAEEALRLDRELSLRFLEALLKHSPSPLFVVSPEGRVRLASQSAERILGRPLTEILGRTMAELIPADTRLQFAEAARRVGSTGAPLVFEARVMADEEERHVRSVLFPVLGAPGQSAGLGGLAIDITDRVRAEQALTQAHDTLQSMMQALPLAVLAVDSVGLVTSFWNPAAERMFGWTAAEVLGRPIPILPEDRVEESLNFRRRALAGESIRGIETVRRRKDGTLIEVRFSAVPVRDSQGQIIATMGLFEDITERKAAERQAEHLASFPKFTPSPVVEVGVDGTVRYVNPAAMTLFPDLQARGLDHPFLAAVRLRMPRLRSDAGRVHLFEVSAGGAFYSQNVFVVPAGDAVRVYANDITERQRTDEALRASEAEYRAVVEDSPALICRFLAGGTLTFVNQAFCRYFGKSRDELIGHSFFRFLPEEDQAKVRRRCEQLTPAIPIATYQHRVIMPDGSVRWQRRTDRALVNDQGRITAYQSIGQDITERREARRQLAQYQRRLRSLASDLVLSEERERRRITVILHDQIGQTLAMAKMRLQVWESEMAPGGDTVAAREARELVEQAIRDTRSLTFDLSPPILYELGFPAAVEWLLEGLREKHGLQTVFEDESRPTSLAEDVRVALFLAVRELLMNVVKHAAAKSVKVTIRQTDKELLVWIVDDGHGFAAAEVTAPGSRAAGFGLFNIREHLQHLGGRFEIVSEPGCGTTATVAAPIGGGPQRKDEAF
jgi:PAS domain S-box-containing protein